ncbi:MAG: UDP-N-acetylmuramoyl-L-alanyl-D-glutamate--2,6-diaminopimelate ligase [Gammaproteobacteria bacterium]
MKLSELLAGMATVEPHADTEITGLSLDSRSIVPGECFVALRGAHADGARFVAGAIAAGARAVLAECDTVLPRAGVPVVHVRDLRAAAGRIAARMYGDPSRRLAVLGVTGTNGKTTVSWILAQSLAHLDGRGPCALIGTLGSGLPGELIPTGLTTPDAITLQRTLADFAARGVRAAAIEVSSHALEQDRTEGVRFACAVFTNLTRDHLDYHADMQAYGAAKARLFRAEGLDRAVVNLDDGFGCSLAREAAGRIAIHGYTVDGTTLPGLAGIARARRIDAGVAVTRIALEYGGRALEIRTRLAGRYNVSNLLACLATLAALGVDPDAAAEVLSRAGPPPGRMEPFGGGDAPLVLVDYAHTPDALTKALAAARSLGAGGRLWCVFGCGGNRDPGKRAPMGAIAAASADRVILTSDNPRYEEPERIMDDIELGMTGSGPFAREPDRRLAIRLAVSNAAPGDVVLVAGKGHEDYQQVGDARAAFSDRAEVLAALREWRR